MWHATVINHDILAHSRGSLLLFTFFETFVMRFLRARALILFYNQVDVDRFTSECINEWRVNIADSIQASIRIWSLGQSVYNMWLDIILSILKCTHVNIANISIDMRVSPWILVILEQTYIRCINWLAVCCHRSMLIRRGNHHLARS